MKLVNVEILKYKSFEQAQTLVIEDDITVLVGMNESGKTSILEAIAKTNYFQEDKKFEFSTTHDYPRREKKKMDRTGKIPAAIKCTYRVSESVLERVVKELGQDVFVASEISVTTKYDGNKAIEYFNSSVERFVKAQLDARSIYSATLAAKLVTVTTKSKLHELISTYKEEQIVDGLTSMSRYYSDGSSWSNPVDKFIWQKFLNPSLPKFLYYDEYYSLPSRIVIEKLTSEELEADEMKTAKALLELADLQVDEIIKATDFEDYVAELEATEATISDELFEYWTSNRNLSIQFRIQGVEKTVTKTLKNNYNQNQVVETTIVEHILDIRVKNSRTKVSLPLKNRSKGFNWFFSFLVWFKKIQEEESSQFVLLLDEPGLNLHASAQADLLRFIEDLSKDYQIIYTTHSPFAIPNDKLHRVRTVVETDNGSKVSDSIQEKDPKTLFPLQAALGYDIAQNLFVSPRNLLVEGVSDLVYLTRMSALIQEQGLSGLRDDITIVPTGGLEKVATFISLLRGSSLQIACLLDSYTDSKAKAKMDKVIREKLIKDSKVRFYDQFTDGVPVANVEDLFSVEEYIQLYNAAFRGSPISTNELPSTQESVIPKITRIVGRRFNHYLPAKSFLALDNGQFQVSEETIKRFAQAFNVVNSLID